jgi:protein phosphatase
MVDDVAMEKLLRDAGSLESCSAALVGAANEAGGKDNISVILVRATAAAAARPWWQFRR